MQASQPARVLLTHPSSTTTKKNRHMNIFNQATKVGTMLLLGFVLHTTVATAQSDEVEYQDAQSGMGEDNDDRLRRQQEEEDRNNSNYNNAQASSGAANEDGANPPDPEGDPGLPIDGGLSVLLAAGAAYGVKRMRNPHPLKGGKKGKTPNA